MKSGGSQLTRSLFPTQKTDSAKRHSIQDKTKTIPEVSITYTSTTTSPTIIFLLLFHVRPEAATGADGTLRDRTKSRVDIGDAGRTAEGDQDRALIFGMP